MKVRNLIWMLFLTMALSAQEKGITPLPVEARSAKAGTTRAVVIGISDYQNPEIPDLQFAARDAEAFAQFLRSPAGGNLDKDHLQVLSNEQATLGNIVAAFDALIAQTREGDQAIIYFSGHGDVESKYFSQRGYLLCWDASPHSYVAGGCLKVADLQDIVSTLSIQNKVKVLLITDACHAGKLAGSEIGGTHATAQALTQQFANEVKILSCQPNEFSLEGEQWGGGRGIFSYHLVDGLYGLADKNNDATVTLSEIDRYLEDHVAAETAPQAQNPMVVGNKTERVATVNTTLLKNLQQFKAGQLADFLPIQGKGLEEDALEKVDSSIRETYYAFKKALAQKQFFEPAGACAEDLYTVLSTEPGLMPLHGLLKRNYAAALQDDAQQVINRILFYPEKERPIWYSPERIRRIYGPYPRMLERAAELLGSKHYMYLTLLSRKAFFEGGIIYLQKLLWKDLITGATAINKFKESLNLLPEAPHTYLWMAMAYFYNMQQPDSAYYYLDKAIEIAPSWKLPKLTKVILLSESRQFDPAKKILDELTSSDSSAIGLWHAWSDWYAYQGKFRLSLNMLNKELVNTSEPWFVEADKIYVLGFLGKKEEAIQSFNNYIDHDSLSGLPYYSLGTMYYLTRETGLAIKYYYKALEKDPSMVWAYSMMGDVLISTGQYEAAEKILKAGLDKDSTYMALVNALGGVYQATNQLDAAEIKFKRAIQLDDSNMAPYYNLASVYTRLQRFQEALEYLELAIQKGMKDYYDHIQKDEELKALSALPEYSKLMKKYFPDKVKE